jgi:hypothetical protein
MIKSQLPNGEEVGAGIIFGQTGNRLYIVTANHVVRQGAQESKDVRVRFSWLPGEEYEAKLLADANTELDWAVLSVGNIDKLGLPPKGLPFAQLGDASSLKRRDKVFLIGNPTGHSWEITVTPDGVTAKAGNSILFESVHIEPGHSGGALLDEHWGVVGLIKSSQAPHGEATNIQSVLEILGQRGYPVSLKQREGIAGETAGTASGSTGQSRKVLIKLERIVVTQDGSGPMDWVFDVRIGRNLLFTLARNALSSKDGHNIVVPDPSEHAEGLVDLPAPIGAERAESRSLSSFEVQGRRGGGRAVAFGFGRSLTTGQLPPIEVRVRKEKGVLSRLNGDTGWEYDKKDASFLFYFSVTPR